MNIEWLIFTGLTYLLIVILANKSIESQNIFGELMKVLISGYLGYLVRVAQEKVEHLMRLKHKSKMIQSGEILDNDDTENNL